MAKLKVFCATSGFYDNVVAAPSKPAALKAWGAKTDLFSMGVAHLVTDPKIREKALERPGEVIRLARSGGAEVTPKAKAKPKRASRQPSRARVDAAEKALAAIEVEQDKQRREIEAEIEALNRKQDALARRQARERRAAEAKLENARERYEAALAKWSPQ